MAGSTRARDALFPMLLFDARGTVIEANPRALSVLGLRASEVIGSNAEDADWAVLDSPDGPLSVHPAIAALRSASPLSAVLVRARRAGAPDVWLQVDAFPSVAADGTVTEVTVTMTDVTKLCARTQLTHRGAGDQIISEVVNELASVRLQSRAVLFAVTRALARMRSGTWVASMLDKDPRTNQAVAADAENPELAEYLHRRLESLDPPGHTATQGVALRVIESGEPLLVKQTHVADLWAGSSAELDAYIRDHPIPVAIGKVDVLAVPMRARGVIIGTLSLYERDASNPLSEKDIEWMQSVADRTAVAIENAQLYEDAVRRLERLTSLQSLSLALSASPDLRLTLKVILDQVTIQLGVDAADVLLLDESDNMLAVAASVGFFATSVPDYRLPLDEGIPGPGTSRRIVTITPLGAFSQVRRRSLFAREGFKAYGAVPLISRGKLLGALEVFHRTALAPDSEWNSFLEALGSVAAIAIDNASMQDRLRKAQGAATRVAVSAPSALSRLELQILRLVVEGLTNREIAAEVHLSQNTVKFHIRQLLQKTQTTNRTELAHRAAKEGWF